MQPKKHVVISISLGVLMLAILLSVLSWSIMNRYIVQVSIFQYLGIEFLLVISHTFYKFAIRNLHTNSSESESPADEP